MPTPTRIARDHTTQVSTNPKTNHFHKHLKPLSKSRGLSLGLTNKILSLSSLRETRLMMMVNNPPTT